MKNLFFSVIALGAVLSVNAYNEAETNSVLMTLAFIIDWSRGSDCFDENDMLERAPEPYQRYEELFEQYPTNEVGSAWTIQERQNAFESFLWRLPELPPNSMDGKLLFVARNLLDFCEWHNRTNVLPHVKRILLSPYADKLPAARNMFEKFARPSEETYRFVESVMTNRMEEGLTIDKVFLLNSFERILMQQRTEASLNVISNSVRLVRQAVTNMMVSCTFDTLMNEFFPDYTMSSNRLQFAVLTLDAAPPLGVYGQAYAQAYTHCTKSYFAPITNILLNASEPLKVLDLSWLDERPSE